MGTIRRYSALSVVLLLVYALSGVAGAAEDTTSLHEQPVLVLEPGMHTAIITRADVSATGAYAVTGSYDKTVRLWAVPTGQLLRTIRLPQGPGHVGKVFAVAISPDGALVAAGGWTSAGQPEHIYLFDRATGALVQRLTGVPESVHHLVFSPTGRYLAATLGRRGGLRVYDRDAGWGERARDATYRDDSYGAAFAADGRLVTTSLDGHLRLYGRNFQRVATVPAPDGTQPFGVAFTPTGNWLAVGYRDTTAVSLLDGHTLASLSGPPTRGDNGDFSEVAWAADGATLYAGGNYNYAGINAVVAWATGGNMRLELAAGRQTLTSLRPLADGGLLVAAQDPWLAVLDAAGRTRWSHGPQQLDLRGTSRTLRASAEGHVVDFGYASGGQVPARFDLSFDLMRLALHPEPPQDGQSRPPEQTTLPVKDWNGTFRPTLYGMPLALEPNETSRSLAIHPDGRRFVLGTDWYLRSFTADRTPLWRQAVPSVVWAVNITADGRLVVAAYGDGTLRWHRMDDGRELLALFPLVDRTNWVAWTPEGVYAATPGAYGVLRWHVNRGWEPGEAIPVNEIPETNRPEVIRLVLQELGTPGAIAVAELAKIRDAIQRRTRTTETPGARLHVLTVGVSDYGQAATHLRLNFAAADAHDVAAALLNTQANLYAKVFPQYLSNHDATRAGILRGLAAMREAMAKGDGRDLAVVHFSGHGTLINDEFYLLPHGVNVNDPVATVDTALSATALRQQLTGLAQYGRVLVLLDACRSGGAMATGQALAVDATRLRAALVGANITVLTSSTADQLSREDPAWGNGAFTEVLLEALSSQADTDKNGMISVSELTGYLTRRVPALTSGAQQPGVEMRFDGDVFVARF